MAKMCMINAHCIVAVDTVKILVICRNVRRDNECSRDVQVLNECCYSADGKSGSQVFMLMAWKGCKASITTDVCRVLPLIGSPCRIF